MIRFQSSDEALYLHYRSEDDPHAEWLLRKFRDGETHRLRKSFTLGLSDLVEPRIRVEDIVDDGRGNIQLNGEYYDGEFVFLLGPLEEGYYRLTSSILDTENTFWVHQSVELEPKFFVAHRDISILRRLDRLVAQDVYIGGPSEDALPILAYRNLLRNFPTSTELDRYSAARIDGCVRDYLETSRDHGQVYQEHLNRRIETHAPTILPRFAQSELDKYTEILNRLNQMLASETGFTEAQWQQEILAIVRLIFPKYIRVFEGVSIRDTVNNTRRELDYMLVDSAGHIDLIEIKKPFDRCILSRAEYRNNFVPTKELTGSIMQLEKYIFYLNKWGGTGEKVLTRRYEDQLPAGLSLKVVNPQGIVILGREQGMTPRQRQDFEVVKRKYRNVVDIITYDDLLARIQAVIESFSDMAQVGNAQN